MPDSPIPIPRQAAFGRVMTVTQHDGKYWMEVHLKDRVIEKPFETREEAVKAIAEERKKGPSDYQVSEIVTSTVP